MRKIGICHRLERQVRNSIRLAGNVLANGKDAVDVATAGVFFTEPNDA